MEVKYFDAHCHLQMEQFSTDQSAVIARMLESNTAGIVVGVDYTTSKAAAQLAANSDFLWAAIGLHPTDNPGEAFDTAAFTELAQHPKVVAIGECGLDYFRSGGTPEEKSAQKERFVLQGELAQKTNKALIIHCRNAHDDMQEILHEKGWTMPIIIHFCTVSGEVAQKYIDLGCYLSFPGPITYTDMYDESIRVAPLNKILSETDSPFAAPVPNRGKRNEPVYVSHVVAKIAAIKGVPVEEMAAQIVQNSEKAFGIAG